MPKCSCFNCADYTSILWIPCYLVEFRLERASGAAAAVLKGSSSPRWNNLRVKLWPGAPEVPFNLLRWVLRKQYLPSRINLSSQSQGFLRSLGSPLTWRRPNCSPSICIAPKPPFDVVCHKRVWDALKWQHLGVFFSSSICSLLEL